MKDFQKLAIALNRMRSRFNTQLQPQKKTNIPAVRPKSKVCSVPSMLPPPQAKNRAAALGDSGRPNAQLGVAVKGLKMKMKIIKQLQRLLYQI